MMANKLQQQYPQFFELSGIALNDGYIYIGVNGLNPETNSIPIFLDGDLNTPISQPLRTSGGYIYYNGNPVSIYFDESNYSITVKNSLNNLIYTILSNNAFSSPKSIDTIEDLATYTGTGLVIVKDLNRGGIFIYDATQSAVNNGGTIFDGWVRQYSGAVNVKWFGAVGSTDDDVGIQKAINYAHASGKCSVYFPNEEFGLSNSIYTQDGTDNKIMNFYFDKTILRTDFIGSEAIIVNGGAYFQVFDGYLQIRTSLPMDGSFSNRDTTSHGIKVYGTRLIMNARVEISQLRGYGLYVRSIGNGNGSKYNLYAELCNIGAFFSDTQDDLSLVDADIKVSTCASYGFLSGTDTPLRGWRAKVTVENCCRVDNSTSFSQIQIGKATSGQWTVYGESYNNSREVVFNFNSIGNTIFNSRNNDDNIINGNIVIAGNGRIEQTYVEEFTPVVVGHTTAGTATYTTQTGTFQKIGNTAHIEINIAWSGGTGVGRLRIHGLPSVNVVSGSLTIGSIDISGLVSGDIPMATVTLDETIWILKNNAGASGFITYQASGSLKLSGTYQVA